MTTPWSPDAAPQSWNCFHHHAFLEVDRSAIDGEGSVAVVVNCPPLLARRVGPDPDGFQDEEAVFVDERGIGYPAFDIGDALRDQRGLHVSGRKRRQLELGELVDGVARAIADVDHLACKIEGRDGDHALAGLP